jgi:hypothetical protein
MDEELDGSGTPEIEEVAAPASAELAPEQQEADKVEQEIVEEEQPRKPSAKDRIDELTKRFRDEEREKTFWREQAMSRQAPKQPEPEPTEEAEPDPASYEYGETDVRYIKDVAKFEVRREIAANEAKNAEARKAETVQSRWQQEVSKAVDKYPDFEDRVFGGAERREWQLTPVAKDAIFDCDSPADVAYHLATNPTEAARIARLSPLAQVREIGKLEAKLAEPTKPTPKTATDAPPPPPQIRGNGGRFTVAADTSDFAAFEKQYGGS